MNNLWWLLAAYLPIINALTYLAFAIDKERAQRRLYRIPEGNLLLLALLGGSPAAFFACLRLRHKTKKQPFGTHLFTIAGVQAFAAIWLTVNWPY